MGDEQVTDLDIAALELTVLREDTEEDEDHWSCWDCDFDVCGNGGYGPDDAEEDDTPNCSICTLMTKLSDYEPTPCKHCGSVVWDIPIYLPHRTWDKKGYPWGAGSW